MARNKKDEKDDVYLVFRNDNLPPKFKDNKKVIIGTANNARSFAVIHKGTPKEIFNYRDETIQFIDLLQEYPEDRC